MYKLTFDLDWGMRGSRRLRTVYFKNEPTQAMIDHWVAKYGEHYTLTKLHPGQVYNW